MGDYLVKKPNLLLSHLQLNCLWESLKNWYAYRVTIIAHTFCGLTEITLTAIELQDKIQTSVNHSVKIL